MSKSMLSLHHIFHTDRIPLLHQMGTKHIFICGAISWLDYFYYRFPNVLVNNSHCSRPRINLSPRLCAFVYRNPISANNHDPIKRLLLPFRPRPPDKTRRNKCIWKKPPARFNLIGLDLLVLCAFFVAFFAIQILFMPIHKSINPKKLYSTFFARTSFLVIARVLVGMTPSLYYNRIYIESIWLSERQETARA